MANWMQSVLDGAHKTGTQSGSGTIDPDGKTIIFLTTLGVAAALVLSDGDVGQYIFITVVTDGGGDGTIVNTTTNLVTYSSIVFNDVGDWGCFKYNGRAWELVSNRGLTLTTA